ncbi:MAG: sulfite exporter TauE/SafE family protein [Chitinophagales bacterium]
MSEILIYFLVIFVGILSGFINTLAGNGSALTLTLLAFLGLPATMANGTNRVGVLFQSCMGFYTFRKKGKNISLKNVEWLVVPAVLGAFLGAAVAVEIDEKMMNLALGLLMIFLLFIVLFKPKQWLQEQIMEAENVKSLQTVSLMFLVGVYGGFLQAGVGILLLSVLALSAGYSLTNANAVKLLIVLCFTIPALLLFVYNGQVNWFYGLWLSIGQVFGAWLAATFATQYKQANVWVRYLLIFVIIGGIFKFLVFST